MFDLLKDTTDPLLSYFPQPDRVTEFCKKNKLQLIIRAHECVMDGFERFAQGQLITLFSATNYCGKHNSSPVFSFMCVLAFQSHGGACYLGTANNAGAILVVGRGLVVVPKLIHPLPPPLQSPETSPEHGMDETWMQVGLNAVSCFLVLYLTTTEKDEFVQ